MPPPKLRDDLGYHRRRDWKNLNADERRAARRAGGPLESLLHRLAKATCNRCNARNPCNPRNPAQLPATPCNPMQPPAAPAAPAARGSTASRRVLCPQAVHARAQATSAKQTRKPWLPRGRGSWRLTWSERALRRMLPARKRPVHV